MNRLYRNTFAPTAGDVGEQEETEIEVLPLAVPETAPAEPSPAVEPVPA